MKSNDIKSNQMQSNGSKRNATKHNEITWNQMKAIDTELHHMKPDAIQWIAM